VGDRGPAGRSRIVIVAGTGTEVGKTYVTARLAAALRARGLRVVARKPVQSFAAGDDAPTDADVLAGATGEDPLVVCPPHRRYPRAMAPPMAAEALGRPAFTIADLAAEITTTAPADALTLVESAGGVRSPLAADGDTVALVEVLRPALIVLVADAGLGTINAVHLSIDALPGHRVVVFLNRFDRRDDLHRRNRDWLATRAGLEVVNDPEALERVVAAVVAISD
jgi:dethiobiotin synthetase